MPRSTNKNKTRSKASADNQVTSEVLDFGHRLFLELSEMTADTETAMAVLDECRKLIKAFKLPDFEYVVLELADATEKVFGKFLVHFDELTCGSDKKHLVEYLCFTSVDCSNLEESSISEYVDEDDTTYEAESGDVGVLQGGMSVEKFCVLLALCKNKDVQRLAAHAWYLTRNRG